jgi:hypothetical protein
MLKTPPLCDVPQNRCTGRPRPSAGHRKSLRPVANFSEGACAATRFVVWWTTAFVTSMIVGAVTFGIRQFFH